MLDIPELLSLGRSHSRVAQQLPDVRRPRGHRRQELCARQRLEAVQVEGRGAQEDGARGRRRRSRRRRRRRRARGGSLLAAAPAARRATSHGRDLSRDGVQRVPDRGRAEGVVEVERGLGRDKLLVLSFFFVWRRLRSR